MPRIPARKIPPERINNCKRIVRLGCRKCPIRILAIYGGVVFCAEEALLPPAYMEQVLDYTDHGRSAFVDNTPQRVITCLPVSNKVVKEKSNSWIPIFNMSDKKQTDVWTKFETAFRNHPTFQEKGTGSILRFGSLFGGSVDGPPQLQPLGLDEGIYKVRLPY